MAGWLKRFVVNSSPSAENAPSGSNACAKEPNSVWAGAKLLRKSVETPELGSLAKLPPFAPVIIGLLALFDREDVDQSEVVKLVEADATLTAEILGITNSPLYPVRGSITSPAHGVALLGTDQIKALATTLALRTMLNGCQRMGTVRRLWKHSIATAAIAQQLAPLYGINAGLGYTVAVVHDLGRLGLLAAHGEAYAGLMAAEYDSVEEILSGERTRFGLDHCSAGLLLSRAWGLPAVFQDTIAHHHRASSDSDTLGLIHLACLLAHAFGFESMPRRQALTPAEAVGTSVPERLREELTGRLERLKLATSETIETFDF